VLVVGSEMYPVVGVLSYRRRGLRSEFGGSPIESTGNWCPRLEQQLVWEPYPRRRRRETETVCEGWKDCPAIDHRGYRFDTEKADASVVVRIKPRSDRKKNDRFRLAGASANTPAAVAMTECDVCLAAHSTASPTCSMALRLPPLNTVDRDPVALIDAVTRTQVRGWTKTDLDIAGRKATLKFTAAGA